MIKLGRVIKIISNSYTVDVEEKKIECVARGKFRKMKISPVVGDIVEVDIDLKTIENICERKNILERPVVANIDIALIVTSTKEPALSLNLLDKLLSIILIKRIEPIICFTKIDLLNDEEWQNLEQIKKYYEQIGVKVVYNNDLGSIKKIIREKVAVVTGQTGAGKSSLLNKLDENLHLETKPISKALNRGVHTTRHVELFKIDDAYIVDTPGFSALDFKGISIEELKKSFKEFDGYSCEFKDCLHKNELGCQVIMGVDAGEIKKSRYENYLKFLGEIYESNSKLYK